ncbi:fructosamine kinase family protein [Candidatus Poribacteria bacterium]
MTEQQSDIPITQAQAEVVLSRWLGQETECTGIQRLYGGMINSVLKLSFDQEPFDAVLKLRRVGDDGSVTEARNLEYLSNNSRFPCPQVYYEDSSGKSIPFAFLLLETIPGVPMGAAQLSQFDRTTIGRELAEILLELHSHTRDTFGCPYEQQGPKKWTDIFIPRLLNMRKEMEGKLPQKVLRDIECVIEPAEGIMSAQGQPTLVHGDIWAGNIMVSQKEDGWHIAGIIDPGTQYADVEMELAFLEVFKTVGSSFLQTYTTHNPLRPGYKFRRLFYWLNTYMIHAWLFPDAHYRQMTGQLAEAILQQLSKGH